MVPIMKASAPPTGNKVIYIAVAGFQHSGSLSLLTLFPFVTLFLSVGSLTIFNLRIHPHVQPPSVPLRPQVLVRTLLYCTYSHGDVVHQVQSLMAVPGDACACDVCRSLTASVLTEKRRG